MNATSLYVSTCRLVLQADVEDPNSWTDLYRLVPYLRQSLSCTVCSNLLIEPHTPTETNCQHHVCRGCRGGRKKLKPSCGWCKDYEKYVENVQLRILLQCYKKLCEYLTSTTIYRSLLPPVSVNATSNGASATGVATATTTTAATTATTAATTTSLTELIQEGAGFKDEFKSNSGLSKSAYSILPCVYTSTTSTQTQGGGGGGGGSSSGSNVVGGGELPPVQSNIPAESPAIRTVSNGSSIYSVMYAGTGNKITIKRKAAATEETDRIERESDGSQQKQLLHETTSSSSSSCTQQQQQKKFSVGVRVQSSGGFKKPRSSSARSKRKGCRCGNATAVPGKLTCCGQRCPCYVESKPCVECRCRGCRNPHTADGSKIRPHIPELDNLELELSSSLVDGGGSVPQCLSTSAVTTAATTTIQVVNVYSTAGLDIDNVPQSLPAALLVGEDAMVSTGSEEGSDSEVGEEV